MRSDRETVERNTSVKRVCVIMPVFHADISLLDNVLQAASRQVEGLVIVDNGPQSQVSSWLKNNCQVPNLVVMEPPKNIGVAAAFNKALALVRQGDFSHVLLLDQDSVPSDGMVNLLVDALELLEAQKVKVGAVGPRHVDPRTGESSYALKSGVFGFRRHQCKSEAATECLEADFLISSGTLISLATLDDVGTWDERLFSDHVDTEWFLRARAKRYVSFVACSAMMEHCLGNDVRRIWVGRWKNVPCHRPMRYYYIFRNSILLYRRDYVPPSWISSDIRRLLATGVVCLLAIPPRGRNALMIMEGIWDGIKGCVGERAARKLTY